jgi:hypothetical protein
MVFTIDGSGHISTGLGSLRRVEEDWSRGGEVRRGGGEE